MKTLIKNANVWSVAETASSFTFAPTRSKTMTYRETEETFLEDNVLPPERDMALRSIEYLRNAKDNFDGAGTEVPEIETLNTATRLVQTCFGCMYPTSIYPGMDRTLQFLYERRSLGYALHITIEHSEVFVSKLEADGKSIKLGKFVIPLDGVTLPTELKQVLPPYLDR